MKIISGKVFKKYKNVVFNGCTIAIDEGEIYLVIGRNGIGKSTLLRIFAQVDIDSDTLHHILKEKEISYMPSELIYYPSMTIKDLVSFYKATVSNFEIDYALSHLQNFNLQLNKKISKLSDGQKKIVNFVLCLSKNSPLYVIDEPFPNVDLFYDELFRKMIIERYHEKTTFIIATHQINEFEKLSSKCLLIKNKDEIEIFDTDTLRSELNYSVEDYFKEKLRC